MASNKSEATKKLEGIIAEFENEVIPVLIDFSNSTEFMNFCNSAYNDPLSSGGKLEKQFKGPNRIGINYKFETREVVPVLLEEDGVDESGIFDRVYMSILEEVKGNLSLNGMTFFYPAIGHDWRVADIWNESTIVGIDPDEGLNWVRSNVILLKQRAQDYDRVEKELKERGLPTKANLILKGSTFALDWSIKASEQPIKTTRFIDKIINYFRGRYATKEFHPELFVNKTEGKMIFLEILKNVKGHL